MAKQEKEEKNTRKTPSPSTSNPAKKTAEALKYSADAYCNIIGAQKGVRFVANLKFKGEGMKTEKEWKDIFKKQNLV